MEASVHARLLRERLAVLPRAVQQLHGRSIRHFSGRCRIDRGSSLGSRLIARVMRFPRAASDVPVSIRIDAHGTTEIWLRDFGGSPLRSRLSARDDLLVERMGPAEFRFRLIVEADGIAWQLVAMRLFGVPLPHWLHPRMQARESADGARYIFSARAEYPIIGLLVHYYGWLDASA